MGMPHVHGQPIRACYPGVGRAVGTHRTRWGDREKHTRKAGKNKFVILERKVGRSWCGGNPVRGTKRVRCRGPLGRSTRVDPIDGMFVKTFAEDLGNPVVHGPPEVPMDLVVAAVGVLLGGDLHLRNQVELNSVYYAVYGLFQLRWCCIACDYIWGNPPSRDE